MSTAGERLDFSVDGLVTIRTGKVEYGQGIWTALAQVAAEELGLALDRIVVAPVSTDRSPDEGTTSGSRSLEVSGAALREACAQARALFVHAAAAKLGSHPDQLRAEDGWFGPAVSFWSLAAADPRLLDRDDGPAAAARPAAEWSVAGTSARRVDLPAKVTGRHAFLHDLVLPGMRYGRVVRPPAVDARLAHLADLANLGLPPDVVVVRDGSFLGVIAPADRSALRTAQLLDRAASWKTRTSLPDCDDLPAFLRTAPAETVVIDEQVDEPAAASTQLTITAEFSRPFLAHASMAPSCAIARWDGQSVTVWSHSQGIFALRNAIAAGLGLVRSDVVVHHVEGAGAYGHNGADDVAMDAVLLARAVPGAPVRVQWTREDEMRWAPFGSAMLTRIVAGLNDRGRVVSWRQDVYSNGFIGRPGSGGEPRLLALSHVEGGAPMPPAPDGPPTGSMGSTRNAIPGYDIADRLVTRHRLLTMPVRTSSLRSLGAFLNVFAIESVMDELAAAAQADPVQFRLTHLSDPRALAVVHLAAEMAGWQDRPRSASLPESGYGIGYARYKGTSGYCAAVAEVTASHEVRVTRLWLAVDVGRVINPDGVRNQVEGGAVQSASWVLKERVAFDQSAVTSANWDSYPILRFTEVPAVTVRLVPSAAPESGAGEIAQGPVAGAIGNAVAHALGVRIRDLPLTRDRVIRAIDGS